MNRESVIIKTLDIKTPAQASLFQIRIPREVEHIIGVEMGLNWISAYPSMEGGGGPQWRLPMLVKSNLVVGELKLQSFEKANVFYSGELAIPRNLDYGDFTYKWFTPRPYTHQLEAHEEPVMVPGSTTLINGVFKDTLYSYGMMEYHYTVKIYVWTQSKEPSKLKAS